MSLLSIFQAIETNIKAESEFSSFNFFRSESQYSTGAQNLTQLPYNRLINFGSRLSDFADRSRVEAILTLELHTVFQASTPTDKDDITRIQDYSEKQAAIFSAVIREENQVCLGLQNVLSVSVRTEPLELSDPINVGIKTTIQVRYSIEVISV